MALIVIQGGEYKGEKIELRVGRTSLGRSLQSDIILRDSEVSTKHAQIIKRDKQYWIQDLGSTNGTLIDKRRIVQQHLKSGQAFQISHYSLTFVESGEAFTEEQEATLEEMGYSDRHANADTGGEKPKLHLKANFMASATGWEKLLERPELGQLLLGHVRYLAEQSMIDEDAKILDFPDVRSAPEELMQAWSDLVGGLLAEASPEEREELIYYFTVGSVNLDYRSMVLNAEVMVLVSGWQSMVGFVDFLLLPGLCEWVDTIDELDALLAPPGGFHRWFSNLARILL